MPLQNLSFGNQDRSALAKEYAKAATGDMLSTDAYAKIVRRLNAENQTLRNSVAGLTKRNEELKSENKLARDVISEMSERIHSGTVTPEYVQDLRSRIAELEAERGLYTAEF